MNVGRRVFPAGREVLATGNKIRPKSFRSRNERVVQIKYSSSECRRNKRLKGLGGVLKVCHKT